MTNPRAWLKDTVRAAFQACGLDVRSRAYANTEQTVIKSLLRSHSPTAVIDVGANVGQFALQMRGCGFQGRIVSFEALPAVHAQLAKRARADANWTVAPCAALGNAAGNLSMHVSANTVSSSLMPMHEIVCVQAPQARYVAEQTVRIERLDHMLPALLDSPGSLYLKVDTQGYEMEVLKGATAVLSRIAIMQLELSLIPLYQGSPNLVELMAYVERLGFEPFSLVPGFRNATTGRILQMDGFFVRSTPASS